MNNHVEHLAARADLWGISDAARPAFQWTALLDSVLWPDLERLPGWEKAEWIFLYTQSVSADLAPVLPRCVRLQPETSLAEAVLEKLKERRGILIRTAMTTEASVLPALLVGLSPNTHAILPDGESVWFRFYDAAILHDYLRVIDDAQKAALFGTHVESFWIAASEPGQYRCIPRPSSMRPPKRLPHAIHVSAEQWEAMGEMRFQRFLDELTSEVVSLTADSVSLREQVQDSANQAELMGFFKLDHIAAFVKADARCHWRLLQTLQADLASLRQLPESEKLARVTMLAAIAAE